VDQVRAVVEVGTEAKDKATVKVLVARNAKIAAKANVLAEVKVGGMGKAMAEARDVVEAWAIEQISTNAKIWKKFI